MRIVIAIIRSNQMVSVVYGCKSTRRRSVWYRCLFNCCSGSASSQVLTNFPRSSDNSCQWVWEKKDLHSKSRPFSLFFSSIASTVT